MQRGRWTCPWAARRRAAATTSPSAARARCCPAASAPRPSTGPRCSSATCARTQVSPTPLDSSFKRNRVEIVPSSCLLSFGIYQSVGPLFKRQKIVSNNSLYRVSRSSRYKKITANYVLHVMKNGRSSFSEKKFVLEKIEFKNHFRPRNSNRPLRHQTAASPSARSISRFSS